MQTPRCVLFIVVLAGSAVAGIDIETGSVGATADRAVLAMPRLCGSGAGGMNVTVTQNGASGQVPTVAVFGAAAWDAWQPGVNAYAAECSEWLAGAREVRDLAVGVTYHFVPPVSGEFWHAAFVRDGCASNVSDFSYSVSVDDPLASQCMGVLERLALAMQAEWMELLEASLHVPGLHVAAVAWLYCMTVTNALGAAAHKFAATRSVSRVGKNQRMWVFAASFVTALALYALATGTGYARAYRVVVDGTPAGPWTWSDTAAAAAAPATDGAVVHFRSVAIARYVARTFSVAVVTHAVSLYTAGVPDAYTTAIAATSASCQGFASVVFTPSRWVFVLLSWICGAYALTRLRRKTRLMRSRMYAAVGVAWALDALAWLLTDGARAADGGLGVAMHATIDTAATSLLPLAMRGCGYKRPVPTDLTAGDAESDGGSCDGDIDAEVAARVTGSSHVRSSA